MAWANSKIFAQYVLGTMDRSTAFDIDTDASIKVALYNDSITPDNTVSLANSCYNAGQWANTNEQYQAGQWAQGGVALTSYDVTTSTTTVMFDATVDTASGSACTLANVYGCLVYDDTIATPSADPGLCYNYFGGVNSVTNGTFTVVWAAAGIMSFSVA